MFICCLHYLRIYCTTITCVYIAPPLPAYILHHHYLFLYNFYRGSMNGVATLYMTGPQYRPFVTIYKRSGEHVAQAKRPTRVTVHLSWCCSPSWSEPRSVSSLPCSLSSLPSIATAASAAAQRAPRRREVQQERAPPQATRQR